MRFAAIRNRQNWQVQLQLGDSLADIAGGLYAYPPDYMTQLGTFTQEAAGGRTLSYYATNIAAILAADAGDVWTNAGINDVVLYGKSAAQMLTDLETIRDAVVADGREFMPFQLTPFKDGISSNWTSAYQAVVDAYNAALPNWCLTRGHHCGLVYDAMEDPAAADEMRAAHKFNAGTDDLHYSVAGAQHVARIWDAGIMAARRRIKVAA